VALTTLHQGDRVRLKHDIGLLKAGAVGIVIDSYGAMPAFTTGEGALMDMEPHYAAVFPSLRLNHPPENGPWTPDGLDHEGLNEGDVLPISVSEVEYLDNILVKDRDCE
jgi:hypothetical protein